MVDGVLEPFPQLASPDDLLRLESLIAEISARIVMTTSESLDQEIRVSLAAFLQTTGIVRGGLLRVNRHSDLVRVAYAWYAEGVDTVSEEINLAQLWPWSYHHLIVQGQILAIHDVKDLPPEAEIDRQSYIALSVKSSITVPLFTAQGVHYLIVGHAIDKEVFWTDDFITRFRLVGEVFVNALRQREILRSLETSQRRLELAAVAAGVGLWELNLESYRVWVSGHVRKLYELSTDEPLTVETFLAKIHPDDGGAMLELIKQAELTGKPFHLEYRVVLGNGKIRWFLSRGQGHDGAGRDRCIAGVTIDITQRKTMEQHLAEHYQEIERLRKELELENRLLREEVQKDEERHHALGVSDGMRSVVEKVEQVAATDSTVLIQGETGTGKELIAQTVHKLSERGKRPMVTVNCAALPSALVESELFGRERGAYTGAVSRQVGRFELADGSTLFLDEISEMPLESQAKLLRFLEDGSFERLGSPQRIKVNVRVIAATNRDLCQEVEKGNFRRDLYYRLNVFPLHIPPLRERREDIPPLVWKFINEFSQQMGKRVSRIANQDIQKLTAYSWPGNVRELRNVIEHSLIVSTGEVLKLSLIHLQRENGRTPELQSMAEMESDHIRRVLRRTGGRIKGPGGAAELLDLKPSTLYSRMRKHQISSVRR